MKEIVNSSNKIELLLPAGSPEAFLAALEGGADAVYLGMQQFNARGRAKNFHISQLPALVSKAKEYNAKVFVTLNTLIKNNELPFVIDYLQEINSAKPAAVIIQDWGVYHICKKNFPHLRLHASTQMGNHNSVDCIFSNKLGFERVILARELSVMELSQIAEKSKVQLEVFAHGALCYSFSGSCLFSSWAGGMSANRGQCRQPCRHLFECNGTREHFFSMKDLQLIEFVPQLQKIGVSALKIEGRMRSADYVYQVASAYRLAIDNPDKIDEAKEMLVNDGGRDKTTWNFTGKSSFATTGNTFTGKGIGLVTASDKLGIVIKLTDDLTSGSYIRFHNEADLDSEAMQVNKFDLITGDGQKSVNSASAGDKIRINIADKQILTGSIVYQTKHSTGKKWHWNPAKSVKYAADRHLTRAILHDLSRNMAAKAKHQDLYFRIDDENWLPLLEKLHPKQILLPLKINPKSGLKANIVMELPFFTAEDKIAEIKEKIAVHVNIGQKVFCLSRLSQIELFKGFKDIILYTNEQVYAFNDASLSLLREKGISQWILPLENDYPNLLESSNREGIIPLFFHPKLFYSRQAAVPVQNGKLIRGKDNLLYKQAGDMVKVIPQKAVCNFSFLNKLTDKGYRKFLIDLSEVAPDCALLDDIMQHFSSGTNLQGTTRFNLKQGLW